MSTYNSEYWSEIVSDLVQSEFKRPNYSIEIDSFNTPPVLEVVRFIQDAMNEERQDQIARHCIKGKDVKIMLEGEQVGSFALNDLNAPWDIFPVLADNPLALILILETCAGYILKKSMGSHKTSSGTIPLQSLA